MFAWLKKYFIPHEGNGNRPHFLHGGNMRTLVVAVLVIEIIAFAAPTFSRFNDGHFLASVLPAVLDDLTNQNREANDLKPLLDSPVLDKAAQLKANDMATNGYFAHVSPTGKTPWYWLDQAGYSYDYAGENLAVNFTDSKDVAVAWMNSPTHRANILKSSYTEIGTGVATGTYEGKPAIFVAQDFGHPVPPARSDDSVAIAPAQPVQTVIVATSSATSTTSIGQVLGSQTIPSSTPAYVPVAKVTTNASETAIATDTAAVDTVPAPTLAEKIIASPRHLADDILLAILVVVMIALILNIVIRADVQHADLITDALGLIALIIAIYLSNYYISHFDTQIASMDSTGAAVDASFESFTADGGAPPVVTSAPVPVQ